MILTVDIGNSRIKWALWLSETIIARGVSDYTADNVVEVIDQLFSAVEKPQRIFLVSVAGGQLYPVLSEWVGQHWGLQVEQLKTQKQFGSIVNAYDDPAKHGADRWAGVVAACSRFPDSSVCVISAGTAITFDLVAKGGRHLGGYILPSYMTMHDALLADTANIESVAEVKYHEQHIPDNTDDAVNQGLHILLQAGIREFCKIAHDKMENPVQIVLTGGAAKDILGYPDMPSMRHMPDLVMQGLHEIMKQRNL
jgi:type III pantothenate kinase